MADGLQIRDSLTSLFSLCPLSPSLHCVTDGDREKVFLRRDFKSFLKVLDAKHLIKEGHALSV